MGLEISLGGAGSEMLEARGREVLEANGLPVENEGDRLLRSRMASDQLNPSPGNHQHLCTAWSLKHDRMQQ